MNTNNFVAAYCEIDTISRFIYIYINKIFSKVKIEFHGISRRTLTLALEIKMKWK